MTMTLSSIAFTSIRVSLLVEAAFQNFAAGLILAAGVLHSAVVNLTSCSESHLQFLVQSSVACELFPLMIGETISSYDSMIGITAGFGVGLFLLNSVEAGIEFAIRVSDRRLLQKSSALQLSDMMHKKTDIPFIDIDSDLNLELLTIANGSARGKEVIQQSELLIANTLLTSLITHRVVQATIRQPILMEENGRRSLLRRFSLTIGRTC